MRDIGLVNNDEPVARLFTQGMVIKNGAKMSKNLGNVVSPDDMVARYGADATRMYTLFAAPPDRDLDWQDLGVEGVSRFLSRVYRFVARNATAPNHGVIPRSPQATEGSAVSSPRDADDAVNNGRTALQGRVNSAPSDAVILSEARRTPNAVEGPLSPAARRIQRKLHQTIKRITDDFGGRWHFNTSIAAVMELVNELYAYEDGINRGEQAAPPELMADVQRDLVLMLAPFAPYLAHELWEMLGQTSELLRAPWPKYDPELAKEEEVEIAVQVNGKIKARITVPADTDEDAVRSLALADEKVKSAIEAREVAKILVVKGRLVNIVVR